MRPHLPGLKSLFFSLKKLEGGRRSMKGTTWELRRLEKRYARRDSGTTKGVRRAASQSMTCFGLERVGLEKFQ